MEIGTQSAVIRMITDELLTPVIYMDETDDAVEFIGFFYDKQHEEEFAYKMRNRIEELCGKRVVLSDLKEYNATDRIDILSQTELIYSADPSMEKMVSMCVMEDYEKFEDEKTAALDRQSRLGVPYLQ